MGYTRWLCVFFCLVIATPLFAATGDISLFLGQKNLESNDWKPVEDQGEGGLLLDFRPEGWPINIAVDLLGSEDSFRDNQSGKYSRGRTFEADLGLRKVFANDTSPFHPYVGGGLALVRAKQEMSPPAVTTEDNGVGVWVNGGIYWAFSQHLHVGLDLRYTKAKVSIAGGDAEAGGTHGGIMVGYHW